MLRGPVTSDAYSRDIRYEPPKAISTSVHLTETEAKLAATEAAAKKRAGLHVRSPALVMLRPLPVAVRLALCLQPGRGVRLGVALAAHRPHAGKGEEAVEHQQLVTEVIAAEGGGGGVYAKADEGRGNGDIGHPAVAHRAAGEQRKAKHAEQRTIGIGTHDVDGIE